MSSTRKYVWGWVLIALVVMVLLTTSPFSGFLQSVENDNDNTLCICESSTEPPSPTPLTESIFLNPEWVEENLFQLNQTDPALINYVRTRYITPPSKSRSDLPIVGRNGYNSWVVNYFNHKRNGIFIEAGANDGIAASNSLYLEQQLNWTGLLIECNPTVIPILKSHHRRAWVAGACIAPSPNPGILNFSNPIGWSPSGTLKGPWNLSSVKEWTKFEVETIPLYTILASVGIFEVDYFSFDIEGMELKVSEHFPFHLVTFKVIITEVHFYEPDERRRLKNLLIRNGYILEREFGMDQIYVHNSVKYNSKK